MIIQLGGNIELSGFKEVDGGSMVIVKKVVGNYVKKMNEITTKFEKLSLSMKKIEESDKSGRFQVQAKLMDNGKAITSDVTDVNLFVSIDQALSKVMNEIKK